MHIYPYLYIDMDIQYLNEVAVASHEKPIHIFNIHIRNFQVNWILGSQEDLKGPEYRISQMISGFMHPPWTP